jgi:DNA mismatch repair protein MutL
MNKIKKLDSKTINLISAGEVIENPSDIIKELIENSIDANSDNISLIIKNSGFDLIEVKDNGSGISKEDLEICLEKYTTSKIKNIDDLYSINSFGFRGEALSTISAVSKLKIISSTNNNGVGYVFENNVINEYNSIKGTTIIVKDLFYNVPVRKKFLKSKNTEFSKLYNIFLSFVLKNPNIKFSFVSEKKKLIFPKTNQEQRYYQVFGTDVKDKIINLDINNSLFKLEGIIGKPTNYFYYPTNFVFINNRFVYYPQLYKIIKKSYKDYLMIQQKPFFVLFFTFNAKTIDINVHPKKQIVKLENEILFLLELEKELTKIINNFLHFKNKEPNSNFLQTKFNIKENYNYNNRNSNKNCYNNIVDNNFILGKLNKQLKKPLFENNINDNINNNINENVNYDINNNYKNIDTNYDINYNYNYNLNNIVFDNYKIKKIFGQLFDTFILCECENGFLIIDQHAAAERINLEINRINLNKNIEYQRLINVNYISNLNEEQIDFLNNNLSLMKDIGFIYEISNKQVLLKTIPVFLGNYFNKSFFISVIDDLKNNPKDSFEKVKDKIIKLISCKSSIKANHKLNLNEQIKLINDLNLCKDKTICAHGRPTILFYSKKELDKLFKRII